MSLYTINQPARNRSGLAGVPKRIEVVHEEHKKISVAPGKYQVIIVREYDHFADDASMSDAVRFVMD